MADSIDKILQQKKLTEGEASAENESDKFYSVLLGEGLQENFFETRFREGDVVCFSYNDLMFFDYDPEEGRISLEFGGYSVVIRGSGLHPKLFQAIKSKRVAWVKESDTPMQKHQGNETFIEDIDLIFADTEKAEETTEK